MPLPARTATTAVPIDEAMRASPALSRLVDRLRESNAMLASVLPMLPIGLAAVVRAGPVDAAGWSLLVGNAAVAAKLRQLVPRLEAGLRQQGHAVAAIRIKVQQS